jgi:putative membrane protein
MRFLLRWLLTSLAILATPYVISGVSVRDFGAALAAAAVLGVLNLLVKPILILLTLPLTFLSLGLFIFVINALLFEFAGSITCGVQVASFWSALGASLLVSLVSWFASSLGDNRVVFRFSRSAGSSRSRSERTVELHQGQDGKWE